MVIANYNGVEQTGHPSYYSRKLPYDGKEPLLKKLSAEMGFYHESMRLCGGEFFKKAKEAIKKVKQLSTPDYKIYNRERIIEFGLI